jgi:hypothetical protein
MPSFPIPIGGIVRAVTYCTYPGQTSVNQHKWQLTNLTSGTSFSSNQFTLDYDAAMASRYVDLLSEQALYYGTQVYLMNPIGLPPRPDSINANQIAGNGTGAILPRQTSGLISLRTATLGKIGAGRTYVPFPYGDANETNGTPTVVYQGFLGTLGDFLKGNLLVVSGGVTATFRPCLYRGGVDVPRFIEEAIIPDAWATQRRRGDYGRLNKAPF